MPMRMRMSDTRQPENIQRVRQKPALMSTKITSMPSGGPSIALALK